MFGRTRGRLSLRAGQRAQRRSPGCSAAPARTSRSGACDLRSTKGETISEALVGVLIVGLAAVMFATMVGVAVSISVDGVDRAERTYEDQLSVVDGMSSPTSSGVTVNVVAQNPGELSTSFKVDLFSSLPDAAEDTTYTFTRYELSPGIAATSEGGE